MSSKSRGRHLARVGRPQQIDWRGLLKAPRPDLADSLAVSRAILSHFPEPDSAGRRPNVLIENGEPVDGRQSVYVCEYDKMLAVVTVLDAVLAIGG